MSILRQIAEILGKAGFAAHVDLCIAGGMREESVLAIAPSNEFPPPCRNGLGFVHEGVASEGRIIDPDGLGRGSMCSDCAAELVEEYRSKLGETWRFLPFELDIEDVLQCLPEELRVAVSVTPLAPGRFAVRFVRESPGPWEAHDDDGTGTSPCVLSAHVNPGGNFYIGQFNRYADARFSAAAPEMADALEALVFAATARENVMGDPCRLLECKANLETAIRTARAALTKAGRLS